MLSPQPSHLELMADGCLEITWTDGQRRVYAVGPLRAACPCATCREKRQARARQPDLLPVLDPAETQPLRITGMKPVGHYAYTIAFSDGHNTGIYTIEQLRTLGRETSPD
jgi:DUF971 family protein